MDDNAKIIEAARKAILEWASFTPRVLRVWLYGSRIRGADRHGNPYRPDSDLDIAVEVHEPDTLPSPYRKDWEALLQTVISCRVDLQEYEGAEATPTIHAGITDCGELVFSRAPEG